MCWSLVIQDLGVGMQSGSAVGKAVSVVGLVWGFGVWKKSAGSLAAKYGHVHRGSG